MNLIAQFTNSLWNFKSYRNLSRISGGKSFFYLFLLFLIFYLVFCYSITSGFDSSLKIIQSSLEDDLPNFRLKDSKFSFAGEMPYTVEDDGFIFIIDTTGQTTAEDLVNMEGIVSGLLITEDEMVNYSPEKPEPEVIPFDTIPFEVDKDKIINFIPNLRTIVTIVLAIWFIFAFVGKLAGILLLSISVMIACGIFKQKLPFRSQWNIAIYASTLPVLLKMIHYLTGTPLLGTFFYIYWGVAIVYVFLAVSSISREIPASDAETLTEA